MKVGLDIDRMVGIRLRFVCVRGSSVGYGLIGLVWKDFAGVWQPAPASLWHTEYAKSSAALQHGTDTRASSRNDSRKCVLNTRR